MAFDSLPGMKITVSKSQQTFIIGDYFAVYEYDNDTPEVYEWKNVTGYTEQPDSFTIAIDKQNFVIPKNVLPGSENIVMFRTMVEGQLANNSLSVKRLTPRIIPPKYNYRNADLSTNVFSAMGIYSERDVNDGAAAHIIGKDSFFTWLIALAAGAAVFSMLSAIVGNLENNLVFFLIISFFSAVGVAVIIFLIFCVIAKQRYAKYVKKDVSTVMNIVFVVAPDGFGAVEKCVYTGSELIPWHKAKNFYETKHSLVINCVDRSCLRIPKSLFGKSVLREMTDFIAARVEQD